MGSLARKPGRGLSILLLCAGAFFSCTTMDQTVLVQPLPPDLPVSMSSSVIINGQVYRPDDFATLESFTLRESIRFPLTSKQITLDLSSDLRAIAAKAHADAITDLSVQLRNVKRRDYTWVLLERGTGFWICALGTAVAASSIIRQQPFPTSAELLVLGTGTALLGVSYIHESLGSTTFVLTISGNAARLK